jgi:DeoR family transcriptional regulator, suf operon transcriptional repressor
MTASAPKPSSIGQTFVPHKGVRGALLVELKKARRLTAKGLSAKLGLSLNAVRHHLKELEAEGLVEFEREYRGVGAPAFSYRLTQAGEAVFPRRYEATLSDFLDHVVEREGRASAVAVLEGRYAALTRKLQEQLEGIGPGERLAIVARLLTEEGYMAEAIASAGGGTLTEHNCAIRAVAERFPEICAAEAKFLAAVLGAEVHREEHMLSGCNACEYRIHFGSTGAQSPIAPTSQEQV